VQVAVHHRDALFHLDPSVMECVIGAASGARARLQAAGA